jgi:DNA invertase Pin-like site-specific DNA recombinase
MIKGYARVSTDGQTLEAQHQALQEAGATQLFAEKISGVPKRSPRVGATAGLARARGHGAGHEA